MAKLESIYLAGLQATSVLFSQPGSPGRPWREHVRSDTETLLVLSFLMALDRHGRYDIPSAFGFANRGAAALPAEGGIAGPFENGPLRIYYSPLLGACLHLADIAVERVRAWDADTPVQDR